ncbi:MAG: ABC transporter permease [Bryobacteraceae bacterium]
MGRWPKRIFRLLLKLFPAEFRSGYGGELTTVFCDQYQRTAGWPRLRLWMDTVADLSACALKEHRTMTLNDLRISFRRQRKQPAFTAIAIASLALGIGANTAIFSVIHATMLAPLPFREPDRLMMLWGRPDGRESRNPVYTADFVDWRERAASFEQMEMMTSPDRVTVSAGAGYPERLGMQNVTPGYFRMLGIRLRLGRVFSEEEARARDRHVALISESYWKRRFGGDPEILGQDIRINGLPRTIVGVVPAEYQAGQLTHQADLWLPVNLAPGSEWVQRSLPWVLAAGRLRNGVALEQAQTEMKGLAAQLAQAYPSSNKNWTVFVEPLRDALGGRYRTLLFPLMAAVGFVLLIACANVANLLLARAAERRRELALRAALGAGRERLIRELLADGFALAVPGGLLSLGVAWLGIRVFIALSTGFPEANRVNLNLPVLAFTAAVALLTALVAGLIPAWLASGASVVDALKEGGRSSAGARRTMVRNALVVAEMGLAVVLLVGAGLMLNTVMRLQGVALGFDPSRVVTLRFDMAGQRYARLAPRRDIDMRYVEPPVNQFYEQLLSELRGQGWLEGVALASGVPMAPGGGSGGPFTIAGRPEERPNAPFNCVSEGYFALLRIPVLKGRTIGQQDSAGSPWVAVINEALAQRYFPNEDPLGKYITIATTEQEQPRLIVGIVANHKRFAQRADYFPEIYMSFAQQPRLIRGNHQSLRLRPTLAVRTSLGPAAVEDAVRKIVARLDSELLVHDIKRLVDSVADRSGLERFYLRLLGLFAALALALAAVGVFGLMHHSVAERVHEIGIRMALGAETTNVLWMILRRGLALAGAGVVFGVAAAVAATRLIERFLYGVQRTDALTLGAVAAVMIAVAVAACYIPARRAMAVDPIVALRQE